MKATAVAPANIAFIKYWGRTDAALRLPCNASISMNLSACTTTTTVEFSQVYKKDTVVFAGKFSDTEERRVIKQLDRMRGLAGVKVFARVTTENSFPKSTGIASSASGFAALTVAAASALGLKLSEKELTVLARLGSGSACRSIPDGFVKWEEGTGSDTSYAHSLYPHDYWDLRDIIVVVESSAKDVLSSVGHDAARTSPNLNKRLEELPNRIARIELALKTKDFQLLGEVVEEDCLSMHHVMQTQNPPLMYWNDKTKELMGMVNSWRKTGLSVYFTIDAGPNIHLICEGKDEEKVVGELDGKYQIIVNKPSGGARVI